MSNVLASLVILAILGGAIYKLYRDKKNNIKCSGCPYARANGSCSNPEMID